MEDKVVFKWNSIVCYEETYVNGKSEGIKVISKFVTEPKEQKATYSKKPVIISKVTTPKVVKTVKQFVSSSDAEVVSR